MTQEIKKEATDAAEAEPSKQSTSRPKTAKKLNPKPKIKKKLPNASSAKESKKPQITQESDAGNVDRNKELKPKPKIKKKLPNTSSAKESKKPQITQEIDAGNVDRNKEKDSSSKEENKEPQSTQESDAGNVDRNKEKDSSSKEENKERDPSLRKECDDAQPKDRRDVIIEERIDGMIFMCNARTKVDCFRYMVMGLPLGKREAVAAIKPGLKLFLFDFSAKLLYGIYKAASAGGMSLEPAAFNGAYPAQVRFEVHMDCPPLQEGAFKSAITGKWGGKFNTELTAQQVEKLTSLFQSSAKAAPNINLPIISTQPLPIPLVQVRPMMPVITAPPLLIPPPQPEAFAVFGLKGQQSAAPMPAPATAGYIPYSLPLTGAYGTDPSRGTIGGIEHARPEQLGLHGGGHPYYGTGSQVADGRREEPEPGRLHSTHAANALSDYNRSREQQQQQQQPGAGEDYRSLPVSARYSFGGPLFSYR